MVRTRRALALAFSASLICAGRAARADEPKIETADGPKACHAFEEKNEEELARWEKEQPAVPYEYPREDNVLGAPWGSFLGSVGSSAGLLLATVIPHVGAQLRGDLPAAVVSWPWQVPFGPAFTCSRKQGSFKVDEFRSHRAILEPGFSSSNRGVGVFVRPGYRFVYHPSDWVVGAGGGIGSTFELTGNREPTR